jgi:hypothetical protein
MAGVSVIPWVDQEKEEDMRALLFAAAATLALGVAAPASAQVYLGGGPEGAGVAVGPFGFGVGPRYGWRDHWRSDYAYDCPVVRERFVTPSGRVVIRSHRECD